MTNMKVQKIVVTGFLHHDGKVLIIQRSPRETFLAGFYELPGGKVDFGETPQDALKREFDEETKLSIDVGKPFFAFSYFSDDGKHHTVEIVYFVSIRPNTSTDIQLSEDHTAYRWIALDDVEQYLLSPAIKEVIREGFSLAKKKNSTGMWSRPKKVGTKKTPRITQHADACIPQVSAYFISVEVVLRRYKNGYTFE